MSDFIYNPSDYSPQNGHAGVYGNANAVNQDMYNSSAANWKDSTAFAYQQMAKYEDNAFQTALMNFQNHYNSPYQQMQRYQQAGINPFDVVGKQSQPAASASPASGGSAKASKAQEQLNHVRLANELVQNLVGIVKGASSLQSDLQEIQYRKEAFPLQLSMLSTKNENLGRYQNSLIDSNVLKNMSIAMNYINTMLMYGYGAEDSRNSWDTIPLVIPDGLDNYFKPGAVYVKDFYNSPKGQLVKSQIDLREAERTNKKAVLDERKRQFDDTMDLLRGRLDEQKRHNAMIEMLAGAGLGNSVFATLLRGVLK